MRLPTISSQGSPASFYFLATVIIFKIQQKLGRTKEIYCVTCTHKLSTRRPYMLVVQTLLWSTHIHSKIN